MAQVTPPAKAHAPQLQEQEQEQGQDWLVAERQLCLRHMRQQPPPAGATEQQQRELAGLLGQEQEQEQEQEQRSKQA